MSLATREEVGKQHQLAILLQGQEAVELRAEVNPIGMNVVDQEVKDTRVLLQELQQCMVQEAVADVEVRALPVSEEPTQEVDFALAQVEME